MAGNCNGGKILQHATGLGWRATVIFYAAVGGNAYHFCTRSKLSESRWRDLFESRPVRDDEKLYRPYAQWIEDEFKLQTPMRALLFSSAIQILVSLHCRTQTPFGIKHPNLDDPWCIMKVALASVKNSVANLRLEVQMNDLDVVKLRRSLGETTTCVGVSVSIASDLSDRPTRRHCSELSKLLNST